MPRYRGPLVFADKGNQGADSHENITDGYPSARMQDAAERMQATHTRYVPRTSVIRVEDAIAHVDDYETNPLLSKTQRNLVKIVASELKTDAGRHLLADAAARDVMLVAVGQEAFRIGGRETADKKLITLALLTDNGAPLRDKDLRRNSHHELTHSYQTEHIKMPEHLSSRAQAQWKIGREGQAFVSAANDERLAEGKPPLSDKERVKMFIEHTSDSFYAKYYHLNKVADNDGLPLSLPDFQKAFGVVPGETGGRNFLENGPAVRSVNDYLNKSTLRSKPAVAAPHA